MILFPPGPPSQNEGWFDIIFYICKGKNRYHSQICLWQSTLVFAVISFSFIYVSFQRWQTFWFEEVFFQKGMQGLLGPFDFSKVSCLCKPLTFQIWWEKKKHNRVVEISQTLLFKEWNVKGLKWRFKVFDRIRVRRFYSNYLKLLSLSVNLSSCAKPAGHINQKEKLWEVATPHHSCLTE